LAVAASLLSACGFQSERDAPRRLEKLKTEYDALHMRFDKAVAGDPLATSAFSDRGQIVLAVRSGRIEELAGTVALRYLDRVTVDLGEVRAHGSGRVDKNTFVGRVKLGDWDVGVELGTMLGHLRAAAPVVSLRPPNLVEIELPVDIEESFGDATLHFSWNSAGVANAVCRDFEITQAIKGRVLAQRHTLRGAFRLANRGGRLTETPLFPDRRIQVRMDLTAESWAAVEKTLHSQDSFAKCGMFTKAADGMTFLRDLAAKGIVINLPDSIFRAVDLPAGLEESVLVNRHPIGLGVTAETLRVETGILWSSVSVRVQTPQKP